MSMAAIRRAFDERGLPAGEKLTLTGLAWHADKTTWTAFPGISTLEAELGLEESAITRHLRNLGDRGLIQRSRRYDQRGHRLTDAFLLWPSSAVVPRKSPGRMPRKSQGNKSDVDPHSVEGCPAICAEVPRDLQSAYKDEPSTEPSNRTQSSIVGDLFLDESKARSTKKETRKAKTTKPNSAMPAGWPDAALRSEAINFWRARDRPDLVASVDDHCEQAKNHHTAKGNEFADWDAAWRTWFRNALKYERQPNGSAPSRNHQAQGAGDNGSDRRPSRTPSEATQKLRDELAAKKLEGECKIIL